MSLKQLRLWSRNENIYNWQGSIVVVALKIKRNLEKIQVRDLELYTYPRETLLQMETIGGLVVDKMIPGKYRTYYY